VLFGVDATNLNSDEQWDAILFHHLHLASSIGDEQVHVHRHYVLLAHYFFSAKILFATRWCCTCLFVWTSAADLARSGSCTMTETLFSNRSVDNSSLHRCLPLETEAAKVLPHYPAPRDIVVTESWA